jgi:predicted acyltransferase
MSAAAPSERLKSLDQFRGYTVAGMFLVNFLGGFAVCPQIWKHTHDYCSYADTIMPQFLFAAGFALRLSFLKHQQHGGGREAWFRMVRRAIGLSLIAVAWYSYGDWNGIVEDWQNKGWMTALAICAKRRWFATLLHIAVTSIWILPVIGAPIRARVAYAAASGLGHVALSAWFNYLWVNGQSGPGGVSGIDGGPLGFLTWCIPAIAGTWAYDVVRAARSAPSGSGHVLAPAIGRMIIAGGILAASGWLISCGTTIYDVPEDQVSALSGEKFARNPVIPSAEQLATWNHQPAEPPFVPPPDQNHRKWNYWMMSQRGGTLSYPTFTAGFSLLVMAIFVWACDVKGWRLGVFRTLGVNALAGYMVADFAETLGVKWAGQLFGSPVVKTSHALEVGTAFAIHFLLIYLVLRLMEWRKVYFRM